jgi:hypothetical protein
MEAVANTTNLYAHSKSASLVKDIKELADLPISVAEANSDLPGLPRSSSHSFLRRFQGIEQVVLAGFDRHYPNNNRYGSPSDVVYDAEAVTNAAQTLAA